MSSTQHQLIEQCATRLRGIVEALDNIHDTSPQRWSTDLDDVHSSAESLLAMIKDQAPPSEDQLIAAGLSYPLAKEDAVKLWYAGFRSEVVTVLEAWEAIGHDTGINPDKEELLESLRNMAAICNAHGNDMPAQSAIDQRQVIADAITGALAFGAQASQPPAADHWLRPFYDIGRAEGQRTQDLAMLVRMLASSLKRHAPESNLVARATNYLAAKGLAGTPLRDPPAPVEQAGGDERVIGWRERILAAHPNSDPGFWPDALLVEHMAAEIADLRAALARVAELEGKLTDWVHEGFRLNEALAVAKAQHSVPDDDMILQIFADNAEHSEQGDEHGYCIVREQHAQAIARKLLAAAPGNSAQHSVPEGWKLVPIEPLLNMMSDKDHDTRITAERQLLSILADAPAQAQHSAPEVSGIGRDTGHPRAVVLYLRKEPTDDDLRAIHDALRSLAAAPGKEVPQAWLDVQAERRRQITAEGWTPEHDDLYCAAELPRAAAAYILNGANDEAPAIWPFSAKWWKPRDARANYVRAAALILAEIERLDRAAASQGGPSDA
ncbi:TPA: hypothetical protein ACKRM1_005137 [Pseudomonas aeruginosa]